MNRKGLAAWLLVATAAVSLTACGDNSLDDPSAPTETFPQSNDEPLDRSDPRDPRSNQRPPSGSDNETPPSSDESEITDAPSI